MSVDTSCPSSLGPVCQGFAGWLVAGRCGCLTAKWALAFCFSFESFACGLCDRSSSQSEHSLAKSGKGAEVPGEVSGAGCGPCLPVVALSCPVLCQGQGHTNQALRFHQGLACCHEWRVLAGRTHLGKSRPPEKGHGQV